MVTVPEGQVSTMEESTGTSGVTSNGQDPATPDVRSVLEGDVATLTVAGELTEAARRPLVRTMTDLLLGQAALREVRLDLRAVPFMNSAGTAVLVQLQKLGSPRGVDLVLLAPPPSVSRPLQLTGLWRRFTVREEEEGS
jgi:stage II sporulation protein AA (anti-sigma F factor antagonist)